MVGEGGDRMRGRGGEGRGGEGVGRGGEGRGGEAEGRGGEVVYNASTVDDSTHCPVSH